MLHDEYAMVAKQKPMPGRWFRIRFLLKNFVKYEHITVPVGTIADKYLLETAYGYKDLVVFPDGRLLPRSEFPELYRVIADHWDCGGGLPPGHFRVPDLRGRAIRMGPSDG